MQNIPYVKAFDKDGKLENPIDGFYSPAFPNRKTRRQKSPRFCGNNNGVSLTVVKTQKYERVMQLIEVIERDKKGRPIEQTVENANVRRKVINHYVGQDMQDRHLERQADNVSTDIQNLITDLVDRIEMIEKENGELREIEDLKEEISELNN